MQEDIERLRKGMIANRVLLIVLLVLVLCLMGALAFAGLYGYRYYQELKPAIDSLRSIDVDEMNVRIQEAEKTLSQISEIVNKISEFFGKLFG